MKMNKKDFIKKNNLKKILFNNTNCEAQHNGWSCRSCFHFSSHIVLADLKYDIHNYWLAVLFFRGDYNHKNDWIDFDTSNYYNLITELIKQLEEVK